jgi:hypothetical protein
MSEHSDRTPLKNGTDWIVLKPEITYGEDLDILDASQVDGRFSLRAHANHPGVGGGAHASAGPRIGRTGDCPRGSSGAR